MRRTISLRSLVCLWAASVSLALGTSWAFAATPPPLEQPNCGATIDHSFRLQADLDCSVNGSTGLKVGADGITIDLNGNTITGDDVKIGILFDDAHNKVVIKNGELSHFGDALSSNGTGNVFEDLTLRDSNTGLNVDGTKGVVRNNVAVGNILRGFNIAASSSKIEKNAAIFNGTGFRFIGDSNKISGNAASASRKVGIDVDGGNGNKVTSNTVTGNGTDASGEDDGVVVTGADKTSISGNVVAGNVGNGILIDTATNTSLVSNVVSANGLRGIESDSPTTGKSNAASGNGASPECDPSALCV